ncbi:MAG: transporter substrate-binding domain-containing protein [Magnetococcales bacterium]|nr:transporter substrate-binding domain-containing protein [Magnetococcales bacterium]
MRLAGIVWCFNIFKQAYRLLSLPVAIFTIFAFFGLHNLHAADSQPVKLTPEEQAWVKKHPIIWVANETDWPPFDFAEDGIAKGYSIDLIKLAAEKVGVTCRFINGYTWEVLLKMGKERKVDLFPAIWKNADREKFLTFTTPYIKTPQILVVRQQESTIQKIEDLNGRIITSVKDYATTQLVKKYFPKIKTIEVNTPSEGLKKVAYAKADAYLGTLGSTIYEIRKGMIHGLKVAAETDIGGHVSIESMHMAVRNDWPLMHAVIQKGLDAVTVEERMAIQLKWITIPEPNPQEKFLLSAQEKSWLANRYTLNFATRVQAPLAISEGDRLEGILGEYQRYFSNAIGMDMKFFPTPPLADEPWGNNREKLDFHLVLDDEFPATTGSQFSQPLLKMPLAIVTSGNVGFIEKLEMVGNEPIAVRKNRGILNFLHKRYPSLNLIMVTDSKQGLSLVNNRVAFAYLDLAPVAQYFVSSGDYGDLKISGMTTERIGISMMVREENSHLVKIMDKILLSLPQQNRESIYNKWVRVRVKVTEKIDYTMIAWVVCGFSLLLLLALLWNRTLQQQIRRREVAENKLREMADEQKAVLDHIPLGVAFLDINRIIQQANPELAKIFACRLQDLIGNTTQQFFQNVDEFHDVGKTAYPILRMGRIFEQEFQLQRHNGELFWCHLRGVTVNIENLEEGFVWTAEDITERRLIQEKLHKASQQAEEANRSKTLFLAHMSHEIRTPLNAILGMNEILLETKLTPEQHKYLTTSKNSGETLLSLINDVLDLSKIEANQMVLVKIDYNLHKLIKNTASIQERAASEKGIDFIIELKPDVPKHVYGDPDRLRQVLLNLLNNAIKFTASGQVAFTISKGERQMINFAVQDTGIGMSADRLDKIFKPFVQADSTTTRDYGGTGLGLTICQHLVEAMGGTITVESEPGKGTSFNVQLELPAAMIRQGKVAEKKPQQKITKEQALLPEKSLNILLVDDAEENRLVIGAYLRKFQCKIIQATNGAEAYSSFKINNIDLVLMDMLMPVMDGYTATKKIREWEQQQGRKPIPIIALTAQALREDLDKTLAAGCDYYLTKPVRKINLLDTINKFKTA